MCCSSSYVVCITYHGESYPSCSHPQAVYKMPTDGDDVNKSVALALQRVFYELQTRSVFINVHFTQYCRSNHNIPLIPASLGSTISVLWPCLTPLSAVIRQLALRSWQSHLVGRPWTPSCSTMCRSSVGWWVTPKSYLRPSGYFRSWWVCKLILWALTKGCQLIMITDDFYLSTDNKPGPLRPP